MAAPRLYPAGGTLYTEAGAPAAPAAQQSAQPLGRVNAVLCPDGLPKSGDSCMAAADPRGFGIAAMASKVR
jgi:hypothetical protein